MDAPKISSLEQHPFIHPDDASSAISRGQGVLFDVREGEHRPPNGLDYFHAPLTDIERFITGELSGHAVSKLVSVLIRLAAKWKTAYILADSDGASVLAAAYLKKLGFRDSFVISHKMASSANKYPAGRYRLAPPDVEVADRGCVFGGRRSGAGMAD